MRAYVDARCMQDPNFAQRGVGLHAAGVIADLRARLPRVEGATAIVDPTLPPLAPARAALFDRVVAAAFEPREEGALFLQPSPMTHDQDMLAPVLKRRDVFRAAILYDFIPLEDPGRYLRDTATRRAYETALVSLRGYERYLSISEHTAREASCRVGISRSAVTVTGVAVREAFFAAGSASAPARPQEPPYFLVVGGDDPRKNVEVALRAHARASRAGEPTELRVVGHYSERSRVRLGRLYRRAGGDLARLRFVSGVSDDALALLYRGAIANVCPSRSEGFSIPVVEAPAAGCPVLVSSCPAQRELMPLEEALFETEDDARLADLMTRVRVPGARAALVERQRPLARGFSSAQVSARFWDAICADLERWNPRPRPRPRGSRPRIAFCSPYPPARSGVADYTAMTVRALARYADVDILATQDSFLADPSVRRFRYLTALPYVHDQYDRIVSVLGNSPLHLRILELLCRYGGPCISHDNRLAELYRAWRGAAGFNDLARRFLGRRVPLGESEGWIRHPERLPTLFFEEVLPRSEPFVVHSRGIQRELAQRHGREVFYLPFCVYREIADSELTPEARRAARARLGIPAEQVVVATFGLVDRVKAPEESIDAVRLLIRGGVPAHLYFVGSADRIAPHLRARAARAGIADHVHLLDGWHGEDVYRDFLRAANLGLQLRTHGFGGLSGAALDCIAYGIPTVMNADLAAALDAPGYVSVVDDRIAPDEIAERLAVAYATGVHQDRTTAARAHYVAAHDFDVYARGLLELLGVPAPA